MKTLDLSGLNCPLPILKTKKFLSTLVSGEEVEITATDQNFLEDIKYFCEKTSYTLTSQKIIDKKIIVVIKK